MNTQISASKNREDSHRVYRELQALAHRSNIDFTVDPDEICTDNETGARAPLWVMLQRIRHDHISDQDAAWVVLVRCLNGAITVA